MQTLMENNAWGKLATAIGPADTMLVLQSAAQGNRFPQPSPGVSDFYATVYTASGEYEIVHCTSRSGASLTVERGAGALNFPAGSRVELRVCKELLIKFVDDDLDAVYSNLESRA